MIILKRITRDKEVIEGIIRDAVICRIALCDNNKPYIIPMNFGYDNNILYIHTSLNSRKLDIMKRNNNICFEMDVDIELVPNIDPCKATMRYRSVVGCGKAYIVTNYDEKRKALDLITKKYLGKVFKYREEELQGIVIIKILIEEIIAKISR